MAVKALDFGKAVRTLNGHSAVRRIYTKMDTNNCAIQGGASRCYPEENENCGEPQDNDD